MNQKPEQKNNSLLKYAGLVTQIIVSIGIALFAGIKLDEWLKFKTPLLTWVLPLLIITGILYSIIKDTNKKK